MTGVLPERYGSSTSLCDHIVTHQLRQLRPTEVVDFGAGAGKNGTLVREALGANCRLVAVEGFGPAARALVTAGRYDRVEQTLLQDWVERNHERYGVAIFGDVLEHLTPRQVHRVLARCVEQFDHIIAVCPLHDIFQDDAYGNALEIHRSYITTGFFDRYDPVEKHIVRGEGYVIMEVLIASRNGRPELYRRLFASGFHVAMTALQPVGLARPFVRLLKRTAARYKWLVRG